MRKQVSFPDYPFSRLHGDDFPIGIRSQLRATFLVTFPDYFPVLIPWPDLPVTGIRSG